MSEVDFKQPNENRDFALLVEGQKVFVDRHYLAAWSPVLGKIFYPEGAPFEQPVGGMEMKEKTFDDFLTFLHVVCPTEKTMKIDESNVAVLVAYADEYDVRVLRQRCIEFMQKQLNKGKVQGEGLIDYLRLASLYNYKDVQKQLVPLVAQLPIGQITAAQATLPLSVLSAIYESKALALQATLDCERMPNLPLPENAFWCASGCNSSACSIAGASSCCNKRVSVLATAAAQVEAQCSLTCGKCSKPCSLEGSHNPNYRRSSCCSVGVFFHPKTDAPSKHISAIHKAAADFSAILLDREK